jgi:hypothetical protein
MTRVFSAETRAKMSAAHMGKKRAPFTAEHRANLSAALKGKAGRPGESRSAETRAKMSAAQSGNRKSKRGRIVSRLNWGLGDSVSDEDRSEDDENI